MRCLYHNQLIEVTRLLRPMELAQARRDAERVMGLRPTLTGELLIPPPDGDPVRVGAERVLAIPEGATATQLFFGGQCFIDQVEVLE